VRPSRVSEVLGPSGKNDLLRSGRAKVGVLDRDGPEAAAQCYRAFHEQLDRLLV
jgi:hypothetical protein